MLFDAAGKKRSYRFRLIGVGFDIETGPQYL